MSVRVLTWAWSQPCASAGQKLVLLALADHAGEDGEAHPGTGFLAQKTGLCPRQVRYHLDALEAAGLLQRRRPRLKSGRLGTYRYQIATGTPLPEATDCQRQPIAAGSDQEIRAEEPTPTGNPLPVVQRQPIAAVIEPSVREPSKGVVPNNLSTSAPKPVEVVFAAWQEATGHRKAVLDKKRRRLISDALKHYSAEDLVAACFGVTRSAFHMGQNERRERYDGLHIILRDSQQIEKFRDLATTPQDWNQGFSDAARRLMGMS